MGLPEDLVFPRVQLPTATLPDFQLLHYLSHPDPVIVEPAKIPTEVFAIAAPTVSSLPPAPQSLKFVMSLAADLQGNLWVGCEDSGVFRYTPSTGQWRHFTTKDGLGDDNAYALAVDHLGRIWAGHLNHGVSVFNGKRFQNYEVVAGLSRDGTLAGPLGERVFKIAVNPAGGDVWIATSAGLARYSTSSPALSPSPTPALSPETGTWRYYTRAEGLPSDQAQSLAFAPDGTLYVGTQCDGIAIASPADDYKTWRIVKGPDKMPTAPFGPGLPTNLINEVLVAKSGTVYAATTTGLAASHDQGRTWQYWRGADYADKVKGLYGGPPKDWQEQKGAWLAEDYITCLAEDPKGNLLIGYRQKGYELANPATGQRLAVGPNPEDYVTALLPRPDGSTLTGTYGDGMRGTQVVQASAGSSAQYP